MLGVLNDEYNGVRGIDLLKKLVERLPEDEEFVGIVYDGSFTLEVLTGRKYKKDD